MNRLPIMDNQGQAVGEFEIPRALLVLEKGSQALHETIVAFMAAQRQGTAAVKGKGEVAGSGRKPWAQKGLGRARAGYRRSPVWRGGGVVFGPQPRAYNKRLSRSVRDLAFQRAFSEKLARNEVRVISDFDLGEIRTRNVVNMLKALRIEQPVLMVLHAAQPGLMLSARNLPQVEMVMARELHPYQMLRYPVLLATQAAMEILKKRLSPAEQGDV